MPCTYISFQEQAEVAIFVDRTKSNMPFEDQLMLSPVDIEHNNIMGMRAALVEAENERRVKHSSGKKQVPVYREQHGKPKTSAATLLKEKALKNLNGNKSRTILAPTPFYTDAFVATAPVSTSPATSEFEGDSAASNSTPALSTDSGLSSFDSIDSIYSLYSESDVESSDTGPTESPSHSGSKIFYASGQGALDRTARKLKNILDQGLKYRSNFGVQGPQFKPKDYVYTALNGQYFTEPVRPSKRKYGSWENNKNSARPHVDACSHSSGQVALDSIGRHFKERLGMLRNSSCGQVTSSKARVYPLNHGRGKINL
ncbi:hypothetical protein FIBSPDRAFT_1005815 [Athelia psychrophila]|uniref:Uncharacterized protein n=1 Tax=Athelia psychrophila TaxID=1759441 RepID=A0A167VNG4_9AGAM|nr:hypothetical protein FIBSPDRAFT_1005815 [Fibularhizoctonia sp. CBS 109695]